MLPSALHEYCTSVHISTGEPPPPLPLTYVRKAMLPVKVKVPSIGVLLKAELD